MGVSQATLVDEVLVVSEQANNSGGARVTVKISAMVESLLSRRKVWPASAKSPRSESVASTGHACDFLMTEEERQEREIPP